MEVKKCTRENLSPYPQLLPRILPPEIWKRIFSYLPPFELMQNVIPVCHYFRDVVYHFCFRKVDLGQDWGQWYQYSPEFLRCISERKCGPTSLTREMSINYEEAIGEHQGFKEIMVKVKLNRSIFGKEKDRISDTLRALGWNLEKLSVRHVTDGFSLHVKGECCSFCTVFWKNVLPFCPKLEELELELICHCGAAPTTLLGIVYLDALVSCFSGLRKLTIHNCINARAIELGLFSKRLTNLKQLHLKDCSRLLPADIFALEHFTQLESLHLEKLSGSAESGLNQLFEKNINFSRNISALVLRFQNVMNVDNGLNLDPIFKSCCNLKRLAVKLDVGTLTTLENFKSLAGLEALEFDLTLTGMLPDPSQSFLMNMPNLVDLSIRLLDLPISAPPHVYKFIFKKMESLKLFQHNETSDNLAFIHLADVLLCCRKNLRKLHIDISEKQKVLELFHAGIGDRIAESIGNLNLEELKIAPYSDVGYRLFNILPQFSCNRFFTLQIPFIVKDRCFLSLICDCCPSLKHLEIVKQFWLGWRYLPSKPEVDLTSLKSLNELETLSVDFLDYYQSFGDDDDDRRKIKQGVAISNATFSLDADGDRLSTFPNMSRFVVKITILSYEKKQFSYHIRKTCLGQVKRFLKYDLPVKSYELKPAHILRNEIPGLI